MTSCLTARSLHARDPLWARQTYCMSFQAYCMLSELIVCPSGPWFVRFLTRISLVNIYVFVSPIEINCLCLLIEVRLVRGRILAMEYSYEYIEDPILAIGNRIDWFLRLDVLETGYDGEILHWRVPKSSFGRYIHSGLAASRAIPRNRLIQTNF